MINKLDATKRNRPLKTAENDFLKRKRPETQSRTPG